MKKTLFTLFILTFGLASLTQIGLAQAPANSPVTIPDANLRAAIVEALGKPNDAQLTASDMLALTKLIAHDADVRELTGLEHARNLENLNLYNSSLSDISALSELTKLKYLYLQNNNISDVSALSGLTQLTYLYLDNNLLIDVSALSELTRLKGLGLSDNNISDVAALSGLTQLEQLALNGNSLNDVSRLSRLTQLTDLDLAENNISDVAALSGLTQLRRLALGGNSLIDVSPLTGFTQSIILLLWGNSISDISALESLPQQTILDLWNNPLSYTAINTHIPAMQSKGINVSFTPRIPATLLKVSGDSQQGSANTPLPQPFVVEVRDQNDRAYAGVPVTFRVATGDGQLSATTTQTDSNGKAQAHLTMGSAPATTVSVTAAEVAQSVLFASTITPTDGPVSIPDVNLRARIAERLGKPSEAQLTVGEMLNLTALNGEDADIQDLTGLEHAYNLTQLYLSRNSVTDVSALAGLTQLINLTLDDNSVSDISALAGLTHLNELRLVRNSVADISALAGLTKLRYLSLGVNGISDVTALAGMKQLIELGLSDNNITDVSAISVLTELSVLSLNGNNITDVIAVSGLTELSVLSLNGNNITDVSALSGLTQLQYLYLADNSLSDVSMLSEFTQLIELSLGGSDFTGVSVLSELTQLRSLFLLDNNLTDLSAISGLTQLRSLSLANNNLIDLSAISGLTQLSVLDLSGNNLTDLSAISGLTQLTILYLGGNSIADIGVLESLAQLTYADLRENPLNYTTINAHIPAMQAKGVNIQFHPRTPTKLVQVSAATQYGIVKTTLSLPFVVEARDQRGRAFAGVPVTFRVTAGDGQLSATNATTNPDGRAQAYLTLGGAAGKTTVSVTAAGVSQSIEFTATVIPISISVTIPDVDLRRKIAETLGKLGSAQLTAGDIFALTALDVSDAGIQDLTGLEHAHNLGVLNLSRNSVTDVSALGSLTRLTELNLSANPLNYAAINTHIPAMQAIGVEIAFDPRAPTKMVKISGEAQQALINTALPHPFVVEVRDQHNRAFAGVPVTFRVTAGGGQLNAADTATDLNGRAQARLTLGKTVGKINVSVTAADVQQAVQFTATAIDPQVSVPDANLRAKIAETLGKARDAQLTVADMLALGQLNAQHAGIQDLTGIEHAHNLRVLALGGNSISDLTPLKRLTQLTQLYLGNNSISAASPLAGLTQLTTLFIGHNAIGNISPISELTQLTGLDLNYTGISDVSPLSALTRLTYLAIGGNRISEVSPLAGLTQLTSLGLGHNHLSDVSPLAGLTQMTSLTINLNELVDVSPLSGMTRLERLYLGNNRIRDVSPLAGLTQLTLLSVANNLIRDVSALSGLTKLTRLGLSKNRIIDVSPLSGLTQLTSLSFAANPLSYASINTHIPAMQAKGIQVDFDPRAPTTLVQVSTAARQGLVNATLPLPFVVEALDQDNSPFAGVPVTFRITSGGGQLSPTNTATDLNGRAQAHLTLGPTPGSTTVSVTATGVSKSAQFTATALLAASPVSIPDANLRAMIADTLGISRAGEITVRDMLTLTTFNANSAGIYDLTGLQLASNLTTLSLEDNNLTETAPLAGLTRLTTLSLNNNSVWNLEPIAGLTRLTTLSIDYNSLSGLEPIAALPQLKTLHLRGNWLDNVTVDTYIPAMRARGIDVRFDARPEDSPPIVRLIYFLPSNRQPQRDMDEILDELIEEAQAFYAEQMDAHGFGRKTFQFDTNDRGKAIVHLVKGKFGARHYLDDTHLVVNEEVAKQFDLSRNIYFIAVDNEQVNKGCGVGSPHYHVHVATAGECLKGDFGIEVAAHELGHAFGLQHDFRNNAYLMSYGSKRTRLSYWAAEWLNVHRAFNPTQPAINAETTKIDMLPPSLVVSSNAVRLRFEVTDADGLHQAQLLTPTLTGFALGFPELLSGKALNGSANATIEFVTTDLTPKNESVILQAIDVAGNVSWSGNIPIDIGSLTAVEEPAPIAEDANGDGVVNIQDLVLVSSRLGQTGQNSADVNGDGVVNIQDLVAVAAVIGGAAAPPAIHQQMSGVVTAADVEGWIAQAHSANLADPKSRRGIRFLHHLLAMFTPKETALLPNYPNPFNPETWLPYQLAAPAEVTLEIHAVDGSAVRALELGHQPAGIYQGKSRAAYWDGRNAQGERVASGIYFYTLSAGDFSATRKMLIRK